MSNWRRDAESGRRVSKSGFTLVELSLSIAFLSILSITIVLIITNAISAYHRGLTLNAINSTGMDLIDDFRATIQNSPYIATGDDTSDLASIVTKGKVSINNNERISDVPLYGVFCAGRYSYIWNSGYFFSSDASVEDNVAPASLSIVDEDFVSQTFNNFKLLKVRDTSRTVCSGEGPGFTIQSESSIEADPPVVLLDSGVNLAIYDLTVPAPANNGNNNLFYSVSFILGTVQGGINVMASGDYCATPGGFNSAVENFDYCAINKFNFAAQTAGVK